MGSDRYGGKIKRGDLLKKMTEKQHEIIEKLKYKGADNAPFLSLGAKKHISLIGFMGAGKTTICNALGDKSLDLDFLVEKKAMLKIYDIFKNFGEKKFRELELTTLQEVAKNPKPICLATGGGVVVKSLARQELKKNFYNIFLLLPPKIAYQRIENDKKRPLFSQDLDKMQELFDSRLDWYLDVADLILDMENISTQAAVELINRLLTKS